MYNINEDGTGNSSFISYASFRGQAVFSSKRSPDGTKVLLMNWETGNTMHYPYTVNQDGILGITSLGVATYNSDPRFSPDQSKIPYLAIAIPHTRDRFGQKVIVSILKLDNILPIFKKKGILNIFPV